MLLRKTLLASMMSLIFSVAGGAHAAEYQHVLLISIDGMHASDMANYVASHKDSTLAQLTRTGVDFTNARIPSLSDSFPGVLALVTGGTPVSHGMFYDVSYDRTLFAPDNLKCEGKPGTNTVFDETLDHYGADGVSTDVIDPVHLPRGLRNGKCVPMYPHDLIRTNTIFEVVKKHGGTTAWADKHPAYDMLHGPSGKGVDDLYTPEITNASPTGRDASKSVLCTVANDRLKVDAIVHEIDGKRHDGSAGRGMPRLLGMNFQAISVAQKLGTEQGNEACPGETFAGADLKGAKGGYVDALATPGAVLQYGLDRTDEAMGRIVAELKRKGQFDSTLIIVSAKHGQSPIDSRKLVKNGSFAGLVAALPDAAQSPAAKAIATAAGCESGACGFIQDDDIALIWLPEQADTAKVAAYLSANAQALHIDEVFSGESLKLQFNDPATDSRTPDIIVQPQYGTVYTEPEKTKIAEHGGMGHEDVHVALIVSNPHLKPTVIKTPVLTSQVAPTVLKALAINPGELDAVRIEHTTVLPGLLGH